jgi:pyrophosphatase PpaX
MQPHKAVLFDLDGTLIDSIDHIVDCWQHVGRSCLGRELTREEILLTLGRTLMDAFEEVAPGRVEELLHAYRARQRETHDHTVKLMPGVRDTLTRLKRAGLLLGVVTAKGLPVATEGLNLFNLQPFFNVLITHEKTARHKPHPDPILAACRELAISPIDAVYVGDAVVDVQAGKAAGVAAMIAVTWGSGNRADLVAAGPDYMIDTLDALIALSSPIC